MSRPLPDGKLRVTAGYIRQQLSPKQKDAAERCRDQAVAGFALIDHNVRNTHGVVCRGTAGAITSAQAARGAASSGMQMVSADLESKLNAAAAKYEEIDRQQAENLDQQMQPPSG